MRYRFMLRAVVDGGGLIELPSFAAMRFVVITHDDVVRPELPPSRPGIGGVIVPWMHLGPAPSLLPTGSIEWVGQDQVPVWVPSPAHGAWLETHPPTVYTCWKCGCTSHHPVDVAESYCGACHAYNEIVTFPAATSTDA